tara:strand:+ start:242 stop:496 length:255 start_codon:yes stop_codon:yes gene_type:complete
MRHPLARATSLACCTPSSGALINAYNPELLDFQSLDAKNKLDNLKLAFSLAETHMGIPCFLDADDMISVRPDEKSVMTCACLPP